MATTTFPTSTPFFAAHHQGPRRSRPSISAAVYGRGRRWRPLRVACEKVVGIDLGTTNSAVAAMEGGKPTIVTNAEGARTTPSVVAYTKSGDRLVGQIAKRQAVVNPENTFFSVKRFIGRKMNEVDEESKQVSYRVVRDDNGNVKLDCPAIGKQFAAEEISAQPLSPSLSKMMEKVRVQASLLAITILAAAAFGTASGASYTVGEPGGSWDLRTNLTAWASTITFHPADQLLFKYDASAHDVVEVTQAGYRSCSAASPVSTALQTGSDAIRLDDGASRRRRYFICSTPGHCAAGMKMEVRVTDDDAECTNRLPPPGPAPPGAPSGITICSGGPPVVISTPGVVSYGAAPRSSAGLGAVLATVVMTVSLLLGLAIV